MNLTLAQWLSPWEFSPTLIICFVFSAYLFIKGAIARPIRVVRHVLFWSGWVMLYLAMHTHVDYFAERVFFIHRAQHVFFTSSCSAIGDGSLSWAGDACRYADVDAH